jgi:class 3 adenylate cyclase
VEAERRQVTVLFTDVVGFTAFSEKFGEEGCFTLMRELASLMDDAVRDHGGTSRMHRGDEKQVDPALCKRSLVAVKNLIGLLT